MIRVDPSPILFLFFLFDPSWSESIRVDPTRTGGRSWSGPTFVPASSKLYAYNTSIEKFKIHCSRLFKDSKHGSSYRG